MFKKRLVEIIQFATIAMIWCFVTGISAWVIRLGIVSHEISDAFTASVSISLVALIVYWVLAGLLTYTFFGLRAGRGRK
jgi:hypothetical protein